MATRRRSGGTLLLFPGAGASRDQSTLVAVERAVAPEWATVRADFPYRKEGRRAPDRPPKLLAAVRVEFGAIDGPVVVGGRSMGGRMCSMVAAGAAGAAIPMILTSLGRDPAQSSSIILTTVTDVVGFSSFLGIATMLAGTL